METVNANAATLCNYEVLCLLREFRGTQKRHSHKMSSVAFEALQYLQNAPCNVQAPEVIKKLLKAFEPFNLTKAEKLMMINNPPRKDIDIQLMVEESEERLTDEQVQKILKIVEQHLPPENVE